MARPYVFRELAEKGKVAGFPSPQDSYRARVWFQKHARQVSSVNVNRIIRGTPSHQSRLAPSDVGTMFMFFYDAKHKDTLPYWDQFPLILPFHVQGDSFKAYNLHYISPYRRAQVLNALYKISERENDEFKRLEVSYGMLGSASKLAWLRPCIKMYLKSNVKSVFAPVFADEWDTAIGLPTARFVGASPMKVWRDSARRVL